MRSSRTPAVRRLIVRQPDAVALAAVDGQVFGTSWSAEEFTSMLANPVVGAWLLREGRWDIGYLCYQKIEHEAEIYRIGILPPWQGRGHGRWLLEYFLLWAQRRRVSRVFLEVRAGNSPAVGLYEATGFTVAERRPKYYAAPPEDALVMDKRLPVKLNRLGTQHLRRPPYNR